MELTPSPVRALNTSKKKKKLALQSMDRTRWKRELTARAEKADERNQKDLNDGLCVPWLSVVIIQPFLVRDEARFKSGILV